MKLIYSISLMLTVLFLGSCSSHTYFYSTMSSNDPYTFKNKQGEFVIEGDSLDVIYNFHGENSPITVGVFNKMSKPVYIDWRQSGVSIDNHTSTFKPAEDMTGDVDVDRFLSDKDGVALVKPHSRLNTQVLELANFKFHQIPDSKFKKGYKETDPKGSKKVYKSIGYDEGSSPIFIKTFLTVYDDITGGTDPLLYETDFYMSRLVKAGSAGPSKMMAMENSRGDTFYVRKEKNTTLRKIGNTSLKILGVTALVTGNIILWALDSGVDNY